MSTENPFSPMSFRWHDLEVQRLGKCEHYSLVWITNGFFYDNALHRPKPFLSHEAHLYAAMLILSGKHELVYVQRATEYFKDQYGR
jgi:hypothetical protein